MFTKSIVLAAVIALFFAIFPFDARAEMAVVLDVTAGPALTEEGLATLDLIVHEDRLVEALPLSVGDLVFFETLEPLLHGEGRITDIYDTEDETITRAIILDHALHE